MRRCGSLARARCPPPSSFRRVTVNFAPYTCRIGLVDKDPVPRVPATRSIDLVSQDGRHHRALTRHERAPSLQPMCLPQSDEESILRRPRASPGVSGVRGGVYSDCHSGEKRRGCWRFQRLAALGMGGSSYQPRGRIFQPDGLHGHKPGPVRSGNNDTYRSVPLKFRRRK